jgi:hypothetical protein
MRYLSAFAVLLVCTPTVLSSCTKAQEGKEKGVIEQQTDKVAQDAVKMIKTPLDQAKAAAEQGNKHGEQVEKQMENQQ